MLLCGNTGDPCMLIVCPLSMLDLLLVPVVCHLQISFKSFLIWVPLTPYPPLTDPLCEQKWWVRLHMALLVSEHWVWWKLRPCYRGLHCVEVLCFCTQLVDSSCPETISHIVCGFDVSIEITCYTVSLSLFSICWISLAPKDISQSQVNHNVWSFLC